MKNFKRVIAFVLVALSVLMFVGCSDAKTSKQVSNKINKETQKIIQVLNSLDSATDSQLEIKDISPLSSENSGNSSASSNTSNVNFNNQDYVLSNKKVSAKNSYLPEKIGFYDENNKFVRQKEPYTFRRISNEQNNQDKVKINEDKVKNYSYQPKYVNDTSKNFSTENLQNYFAKIEDLYNTCSDCICANAECNNCKQNLKIACNNCKSLCNQLNDGTIQLDESQIEQCNSCIKRLNECMSKLNSTKGDLNSLLSTLRPLVNNYYSNFDSLCKCYGQIGECLDTRITDINNCTDCVNELSNIICPNGNCAISSNQTAKTSLQNSKITNTQNSNKVTGQKTSFSNSVKKFYGPIKQKILSTMQSGKTTEKSSVSSAMQTQKINNEKIVKNSEKEVNDNTSNNRVKPNPKVQPRVIPNRTNTENPVNDGTSNGVNNGVINGYNNGIMNGANNGVMYNSNGYANGVFPYGYRNMPNIDTYGALPRNIDTYHNIYSNIDTYRNDYLNEDAIVDENEGQNDIVLNNDKVENDVTSEQIIDNTPNNVPSVTEQNNDTNLNLENNFEARNEINTPIKDETKKLENENNITTLELQPETLLEQKIEQTDAPIVNSPLPNPFDPNKVEKEQTEPNDGDKADDENLVEIPELNKENGQKIEENEDVESSLNIETTPSENSDVVANQILNNEQNKENINQ